MPDSTRLISTRFRLQTWGVLCSNEVNLGPKPVSMERGRSTGRPVLAELPPDIKEVDRAVKRVRPDYRRVLVMRYCYKGSGAEKIQRLGISRPRYYRLLDRAVVAVTVELCC